MTQIALHLNESSIDSDMEFYLTDRWDKHNQVRPARNIVSMTPDSLNLAAHPVQGKIGNFLYPMPRNCIERIYIGPSVKLFSNHWGISFLTQLLRLLEPDGRIVLPVHPEGRAQELGWWSRTSLEVSFQNRSGWKGHSNITAEHDGVMSLKVGCRWPNYTPSTVDWFFQERGNLMLAHVLGNHAINTDNVNDLVQTFIQKAHECWSVSYQSAVIEKIALDLFGAKKKFTLCQLDAASVMLPVELLLSPNIKIVNVETHLAENGCVQTSGRLGHHFRAEIGNRMTLVPHSIEGDSDSFDLVLLLADTDSLVRDGLEASWKMVNPRGALVLNIRGDEDIAAIEMLDKKKCVSWYADEAANKLPERPRERAFCVLEKTA